MRFRRKKKLSLEKQIKLIQLMNNLFASGFHLGEIIHFLERSQLTEPIFTQKMRAGLLAGDALSKILEDLAFSKSVVTQVSLAEKHGNLSETLTLVERNLRQLTEVRKKFIAVATYPLMLLGFLVVIMLGLKNYLLPQIASGGNSSNMATVLISNAPRLFLGSVVILALTGFLIAWRFKKHAALTNFQQLARLPVLSNFIKDYETAYFAREWGLLISQGLDLQQVVALMRTEKNRLFQEVGETLAASFLSGHAFSDEIARFSFFTPELALIIAYGELKSKLGVELALYADECWARFFERCNRAMAWIQPLVFLFVALAIVLIYAAMLLPIYSSMNNVL